MEIKQLHELMNIVTQEVLGAEAIVNEDLSNVVDIGKEIINAEKVDNYVKKLVNQIGKVVFADRLYKGGVPSILMDSWEYGSIVQKISADMPEATENESWKLENGESYNSDVFYQPSVSAKFFNNKVTFEIPLSFTDIQVKESFQNKEQLNGFISMLTTSVENSMVVKVDSLIMRTINNMIAETIHHELADETTGVVSFNKSTVKAVNLLKLYNVDKTGAKILTVVKALTNPDFIRFATYQISLTSDRLSKISTLFNIGGKEKFTNKELQKIVLLSDFSKASSTFLSSDTINKEFVTLPKHDSVPYWQGSGVAYAFDDVSKINVKTSSGKTVEVGGLLGIIADRDALGVTNLNRRVTTNYNPKAEFHTNFYKFESGYYNDLNENFVVFYVA